MATYKIEVTTNELYGADKDADFRIVLYGSGKYTEDFQLEIGQFTVKSNTNIKEVTKIQIWRKKSGSPHGLHLDDVYVTNESSNIKSRFPIMTWIKPEKRLYFDSVCTYLPQDDPNKQRRAGEILHRQTIYELAVTYPDCWAGIKDIEKCPTEDKYTVTTMVEDQAKKDEMQAETMKRMSENGRPRFESFEDMFSYYDGDMFPVPKGAAYVNDDVKFGDQRINGANRDMLELCTEIPEKFGVTEEMISPFLEGKTLKQAIDTKRMFLADYKIFVGTPVVSPEFVVPAPICLFYFTDANQLMPVAIQLNQQKGPENPDTKGTKFPGQILDKEKRTLQSLQYAPVFLPSDPEYTWMIAKMWVNMTDAQFHTDLSHLTGVHMVMEGIVVSFKRQLSPSHPIYKLLSPHTYFLLPGNVYGFRELAGPGGAIELLTNGGPACLFFLMKKRLKEWRLDVHGTLPEYLKKRKIYDQSVLTGAFHYRDDGMLLYDAIKTYVTKYVKHYYASEGSLAADHEIQAFGAEIVRSKEEGGAGILGVPNGGKFEKLEHLIDTLTAYIHTLTAAHAAVNFTQYQELGAPLNYPFKMFGKPPTTKDPLTIEDVLKAICGRLEFHILLSTATMLSTKATQSLGHFDRQPFDDPPALKILEEFNEELREIQKTIEERNKHRKMPYTYLEPLNIPNGASV